MCPTRAKAHCSGVGTCTLEWDAVEPETGIGQVRQALLACFWAGRRRWGPCGSAATVEGYAQQEQRRPVVKGTPLAP
ncbi:hypothetical protein NDU88_005252 [Pleurodeles waltl]|uniref:Uncharacterized protein n=1 Tax=Pleurodeles waltl TaxID=8319 RepID=A0AAV7MBK6_PLEWA|nr:hypothetical protein NDU88_005252 [Pleurodeles waltl]